MPSGAPKASWTLVAAALVWSAAAILCLAFTDDVARLTKYDTLNARALGMVDEALKDDMKTFMAVSGVKAGMAVFEGSRIEAGMGIGLDVEAGDIIQPVYDYIDFIWKILLYALMVLGFYKLLLETGILAVGIKVCGVGLLFYGMAYLMGRRRDSFRRWGRAMLLLGLLFAYTAPLALLGTHYLSTRYTTTLKNKHFAQIEAFQLEFEGFKNKTLALKDQFSLLRPDKSMGDIRAAFSGMADSLAASSRASLLAFLYYILIVIFELLFLPFLSAFVLYKFVHVALDEIFVFGFSRRRGHVKDLPAAVTGE